MSKRYWLVKQEPSAYSWERFVAEKRTAWTGVRNYQARNYLRAMRVGDRVLFYHSVREKSVVGVAHVVREHYLDPTAEGEGDWVAVDLAPLKALKHPVSLETIKADPRLADIALIRQSRLSVGPLTQEAFQRILELAKG